MVYYSTELGFMLGVLLWMLDSRILLEGMIKSVKYDEVRVCCTFHFVHGNTLRLRLELKRPD